MSFRAHFRDKQEWLDSTNNSIVLNTVSDEAAKSYDAALTQICGWYEDASIGGISECMNRMLEADPEFILGRALNLELTLMDGKSNPRRDQTLANRIEELNILVNSETRKNKVTRQELLHVQVVNSWAAGNFRRSAQILEKLITLYPEDVLALALIQDTYFRIGTAMPMRNCLSASLSKMSSKNPLKGYVHGMYSFALEESNEYQKAQIECDKALAWNPLDTWAVHSYAHVLEMQGLANEGLEWMLKTKIDWEKCDTLASHQFWHTALIYTNLNMFSEAVSILDDELLPRYKKNPGILNLHDTASLIYRIELVDTHFNLDGDNLKPVSIYQRWIDVYEECHSNHLDHVSSFTDAHYMMCYLGVNKIDKALELIETLGDSTSLIAEDNVVRPLLEAMLHFHKEEYEKCVDILEGIRFNIIEIGNSHAQRDVFEHILTIAALRSSNDEHKMLGNRILRERDCFHGKRNGQTQLLALQADEVGGDY